MTTIKSSDCDGIISKDTDNSWSNPKECAGEVRHYSGRTIGRAPIKMIYRGVTYDYDPERAKVDRQTHPINQAPYDLIYRGVTYHIDPNASKPPSTAPRSYQLIYRGCTYQVTRDAAGAVTAITPATKHSKR